MKKMKFPWCLTPFFPSSSAANPTKSQPSGRGWLRFLFLAVCLVAAGYCTYDANTATATPRRILKLEVKGVGGPAQRNIKKRLRILTNDLPPDATDADINHLLSQVPYAIEMALRPHGFFDSKVRMSKKKLATHGASQAVFSVTLAPPIQLSQVQVSVSGPGRHDPRIIQLSQAFPIKPGMLFSSPDYEKAKQHLLSETIQMGFLAARYTNSHIDIDTTQHRAKMVLALYTGPVFYFGPITFSQSGLNPRFLQRFLNFKPHERYNTLALRRLEQILGDTNFFSSINVIPHLPNTNETGSTDVPIEVKLTLNKKKQYSFGAGYGTDTGPRGMVGIHLPHLTPYGQHLDALLRTSSIQTQISTTYTLPGRRHPATEHYSVDASFIKRNQRLGNSRSLTLSLHHTTTIHGWKQNLTLNALYDRSRNAEQISKNSNMLVYPRIDWLYLRSDHPTQPQYGNRIQFYFQGATDRILASLNFFQGHISIKRLYTLNEKIRFLFRSELGFTQVNNVNDLPLSFQFYAGGAHSIRGYRYQGLGPGKHIVTASLELQHRLYKQLYFTGFFDLGNAENRLMGHLKKGTGVGLTYLSAIGAITINIAKAMDQADRPWVIQFSMGPEL